MHPDDLLGKSFACECGKTHSIPIREVVYCATAIQQLPSLLDRHLAGRRINLVADERTYPLIGRECENILNQAGWIVRPLIVPDAPHDSPVWRPAGGRGRNCGSMSGLTMIFQPRHFQLRRFGHL